MESLSLFQNLKNLPIYKHDKVVIFKNMYEPRNITTFGFISQLTNVDGQYLIVAQGDDDRMYSNAEIDNPGIKREFILPIKIWQKYIDFELGGLDKIVENVEGAMSKIIYDMILRINQEKKECD